jgi:hypothetical protein
MEVNIKMKLTLWFSLLKILIKALSFISVKIEITSVIINWCSGIPFAKIYQAKKLIGTISINDLR